MTFLDGVYVIAKGASLCKNCPPAPVYASLGIWLFWLAASLVGITVNKQPRVFGRPTHATARGLLLFGACFGANSFLSSFNSY
jgi:hypothetical protein